MSDIIELFADPPKAYRMQPFWFLNRGFDEPELRRQIAQMDEKGVGGAILHCRHGLTVDYMSDEWLDMIGVCVDEMKKRGMEAWLYDEDDWPSGTVGGKLTRPHPEYRMRYLRVQALRTNGGVTYQTSLKADDNTLLCVQACKYEDDGGVVRLVGESRDITHHCAGGKLQWAVPGGQWIVAVCWECPVAEKVTWDRAYYLDTMNPEAVNAFKQMSYEPYLRFKDDFGGTIKGIFTDEPGLMIHDGFFGTDAMRTSVEDPSRTLPGVVIAWTRDLLARFQALKGYDLRPHLLSLLYDAGPSTTSVRYDYYDALTTWYIESYHANLAGWAQEHGIDYIGHTLEDPLWGAVRSQGNQLQVLESFHRPGLDYLGHGVGTKDNPFRILASKCGSSVAHVQGKARVMCESFGGSGHGHTMADRRLDANFMACLGVNMFVPHAFYFSFEGFRKTDWPPTEFYHSPFWPWYKHWADYVARLSLIQSTGHHVTDACVLQPILTVQADMFEGGETVREPQAQRVFNRLSDLLLRLHHDFDYVDDSQLARAQTEQGRVKFDQSQETYPLLIMPNCRVISLQAARYVKRLFDDGGKLLAIGELPCRATTADGDAEVKQTIEHVFGAEGLGRNDNEAGGVAMHQPDVGADLQAWLLQTIPQLVRPDVIIDDENRQPVEDIICCHRTNGETHWLLLVNRTKSDIGGTVRPAVSGLAQQWDLETGKVRYMADDRTNEGRMCFDIALGPADAKLVSVTPDQILPEGVASPPEPEVVGELRLDPHWEFDVGDENVHILDRWEYCARDMQAQAQHGVGCPGQVNRYTATFDVVTKPKSLLLVLDGVDQRIPSHVGFLSGRRNLEIYVNGKQAPPLEPATWQDKYFKQVDITDLVQAGPNEVCIDTISLLEPFEHLGEPAYLVGDFAVTPQGLAVPTRQVHGPFNQQGYPHFVGIALHRQRVQIPAEYLEGHQIILDPGEVHDCCRIVVNGEQVGLRLWAPHSVDITGAVREGVNEIVVEVANSLANLYDKESRTSGIIGPGAIRVLKRAE